MKKPILSKLLRTLRLSYRCGGLLISVVAMVAFSDKFRALGERLKSALLVILGTLILALGTAVFLIPSELVSGGISGIAIIVERLFGGGLFSVEIVITALTWAAFFVGLVCLGKSFALKTLLSSALYPLFITLFIESGLADFFAPLLPSGIGLLISALLGGALVGLGIGLSFAAGGSTGGVDIIALVLAKRFPRVSAPKMILALDSAIILLGAFVIANPKITLLGVLSAIIAALTVEKLFNVKD